MSSHESKVTARIDAVLYAKIQRHFHYGQQTKLFRKIFLSIEQLVDEGEFDKVTDYLYKGKPLTLPADKE